MTETRKFYNTPLFRQCILSVCISMSYFNIGLVRGFSSTAFPSMYATRPDLLPDKAIWSWAGSIAPLGGFFGTILAFPLLHFAGRKLTVMVSSPLGGIAWAMIALAPSYHYLIAGRVLCGVCAGLCLPSAQIYVTECTDSKIRGVIGSFPSMAMSAGILVSYIIGTFVQWDTLAWISCGIALCLSFLIAFLPDSPTWLSGNQRDTKAQRAKKWLKLDRHPKPVEMMALSPDTERTDMISIKESQISTHDDHNNNAHSMEVLLSGPVLRPLGIGLTLLLIQQFSGIDSVIFFTVDIFRASGSSIDGNLATIIVGILQLSSNCMSLFVVDRAGRKPLLIGSACVMSLSMCSMGVAFYLNSVGVQGFGFLPLASLMVFMVGFSCGFGSIPFLLMGEIFPTAQRSLLSSIAGGFNLAAMFFVIKTYHPLEALITTAGTFWIYTVLCAAGLVFVVFCVPETKGRDVEEIARLFQKTNSSNVSSRHRDPTADTNPIHNSI